MVDTRNYELGQRELQCTNNFNKMLDIPMLLYSMVHCPIKNKYYCHQF